MYENGLALPAYEDDKWNPNDTYTADAGMIKSKLAIASHFGNPTARRMTNYDGRDYTWPGEYEYINGVGEPKRGNVYVGSYDNLVTPQIQDNGKTLEFVDDPWTPENEQRSYRQSLMFNKMRDAWSFGENYKKYAPMMNNYEDGKSPRKLEYHPEGDYYYGGKVFPGKELVVTGKNRKPHTLAPRTSGASKNQYKLQTGDLLGAMTTGMNVLSPSQWWGAIRDAEDLQDGFNKLMRGNSGFTTEKYAKEHPYISTGVNLAGDAAVLGVLNTIKPKPNFVPTLNSNLEGIRYAYSRNPELANIGTIEEYNDYIKTIFPESKVRDINYHMGPKGLQELKPSTGEVHNTNPGAHGIYVTPDKSYSQNLRKYTTDRLEKPSGWTYLKRNLTPGGWDKANEIFTDIYPVMVDTKNPLYTKGTWTWGFKDSKYKSLMDKYDAIVNSGPKWYQNFNSMPETIVPKTEQTLILGSDADVAGFRKFIYNR